MSLHLGSLAATRMGAFVARWRAQELRMPAGVPLTTQSLVYIRFAMVQSGFPLGAGGRAGQATIVWDLFQCDGALVSVAPFLL